MFDSDRDTASSAFSAFTCETITLELTQLVRENADGCGANAVASGTLVTTSANARRVKLAALIVVKNRDKVVCSTRDLEKQQLNFFADASSLRVSAFRKILSMRSY
eukprot:7183934-Ditylum_brightwellii.AAC.1